MISCIIFSYILIQSSLQQVKEIPRTSLFPGSPVHLRSSFEIFQRHFSCTAFFRSSFSCLSRTTKPFKCPLCVPQRRFSLKRINSLKPKYYKWLTTEAHKLGSVEIITMIWSNYDLSLACLVNNFEPKNLCPGVFFSRLCGLWAFISLYLTGSPALQQWLFWLMTQINENSQRKSTNPYNS